MGYYFGKGATAPTDSTAATPQAQVNGAPDNKTDCVQKCNERYQKDLDSPSVDYATAQQRYNDCKMSCQDIPAIQQQAQSVYQSTVPQPAAAGAGALTAGMGCIDDSQCPDGKVCNSQTGKCEYEGGIPERCETVADCTKYGPNYICKDGICVDAEIPVPPPTGQTYCYNRECQVEASIPEGIEGLRKCLNENGEKCAVGSPCDENGNCGGRYTEQCAGGRWLHDGKMSKGDHAKCGEGFSAKVFQTITGWETWCCPGDDPEGKVVCYDGACINSNDVPESVTKKLPVCLDANGEPCAVGAACESATGNCQSTLCTSDDDCGEGFHCNLDTGKCEPDDDPEPGEGCEGGHILDDRYAGGAGGRALTEKELDGVIPAAAGWTRNGAWGEHIIYHPDYGFRSIIDTYAFYKGGEAGWSGTINWACEKGKERTVIGEEDWCCPIEGGGQAGQQQLGEYQWPAELQELYDLLMGRGKEFMGMETGYTDEAIRAMFGRDFENIRDIGARTAETGMQSLQREGLMGTGASQDLVGDAAWGTEQGISNLMRDLLVADEDKKKQDLLDYTGAAQSIFGGGMGYNSLLEQINAGRRGEAQDSLAMLLQYFMSLMSSWGA